MGRMLGITGADAVFRGSRYGSDFSTEANDLMSGEKVTPEDPGRGKGVGDLKSGEPGGGSINTSMPSDIAGPHGFNLSSSAQNAMTDINSAGTKASGRPDFSSFDAHMKGSGGDDKALNASGDAESKA